MTENANLDRLVPDVSDLGEHLLSALTEWSMGYEKDDAFLSECGSRELERRILELAEREPRADRLPDGTEWLYRGQGIPDHVMSDLIAGNRVVIEPTCRLFVSWSTSREVADAFGLDSAEGCLASSVVLRIDPRRVSIVCVLPEHVTNWERETLVLNEAIAITMDDVVRAWTYDDGTMSTTELDMHRWHMSRNPVP